MKIVKLDAKDLMLDDTVIEISYQPIGIDFANWKEKFAYVATFRNERLCKSRSFIISEKDYWYNKKKYGDRIIDKVEEAVKKNAKRIEQ